MKRLKPSYKCQSGYSLLEVVAGTLVAVIFIFCIKIGIVAQFSLIKHTLERSGQKLGPAAAYLRLLSVARTANQCSILTSGGLQSLQCELPGENHLFSVTGNQLVHSINGVQRARYHKISELDLCDDTLINADSCVLGTSALRAAHLSNLTTTRSGRFFLVTLRTVGSRPISGAVFVRNAITDFGSGIRIY